MNIVARAERDLSNQALNFLMRGELTAAGNYRQAIAAISGNASLELNRCLTSHELRAVQLSEHITLAGGHPPTVAGRWGVFARGIQENGLSTRVSLLAALEEGELQGLSDYRAVSDQIDSAGAALMRDTLMPEQLRTHGIVSRLCLKQAG